MNCKDCVFSTRKVVASQHYDWCSYNEAQKEITKQTVICEHFIQRNKESSLSGSKESTTAPNTSTVNPHSLDDLDKEPLIALSKIEKISRRDLAFEAEKALNRLLESNENQHEVQLIEAFLKPIIANEKDKAVKEKLDITTSFNNFVPSKEVAKILSALNNSIHLSNSATSDISKLNRRTQDILHAFELTDLSDEELTEYTKELREIRLYRRQAKNFVESVEPLSDFATNNIALIDQLKKVIGETDKRRRNIESRKYYVREETSLKDAFENAKPLHKRLSEVVS